MPSVSRPGQGQERGPLVALIRWHALFGHGLPLSSVQPHFWGGLGTAHPNTDFVAPPTLAQHLLPRYMGAANTRRVDIHEPAIFELDEME